MLFKGANAFGTVAVGTAYKNNASVHTWQTIIEGSFGEVQSALEGSLDGTNFFEFDSYVGNTSAMQHVVNKTAKWLRGRVGTFGGAGTVVVTWLSRTESDHDRVDFKLRP